MAAKYSAVPSDDFAVDLSNDTTRDKTYPKYFSFTSQRNMDKYQSAFTYKDWNPNRLNDISYIQADEAGFLHKCFATVLTILAYILIFVTFPLSCFCVLKKLRDNERAVMFRVGRLLSVRGPGRYIQLPGLDICKKVDVSPRAFIPPLVIMTEDGGAVEVGADVFFFVFDPIKYVSSIQDLNHAIRVLSQTALQRHLSKQMLSQIDRDKHSMVQQIKDELNQTTKTWGVEIHKVELSPVKVMQEADPMRGVANPLNILKGMLCPQGGNAPVMCPQGNTPMPFSLPGQLPHAVQRVEKSHDTAISHDTKHPEPAVMAVQIMEAVRPHLSYDLVKDIGATFRFIVTGSHGGEFFLDLKNGSGNVGHGKMWAGFDADSTLKLSQEDLEAIFQGNMSSFQAYMSGRLQIQGDLQAAMSLQDLIAKVSL